MVLQYGNFFTDSLGIWKLILWKLTLWKLLFWTVLLCGNYRLGQGDNLMSVGKPLCARDLDQYWMHLHYATKQSSQSTLTYHHQNFQEHASIRCLEPCKTMFLFTICISNFKERRVDSPCCTRNISSTKSLSMPVAIISFPRIGPFYVVIYSVWPYFF